MDIAGSPDKSGGASPEELETVRAARDKFRAERAAARAARDAAREELATVRAELKALREQRENLVRKDLSAIETRLRSVQRRLWWLQSELLTEAQAMHQLIDRFAPKATLPNVAGWALSPTSLLALADIIETASAKMVVECGSGTSTLWIGYALRRAGRGKVVALDHLDEYAEKTREMIAAHGLEDFVEVRNSPLVERVTQRGTFSWYDIDPASLGAPIDVLLVDGPPGGTGPHARYPALPVFANYLGPNARIMCDDMERPEERKVVEYWIEEDPRVARSSVPGPGVEVLSFTP